MKTKFFNHTIVAFVAIVFLFISDWSNSQDVSPVMSVQITGGDEVFKADVENIAGKKRLLTTTLLTSVNVPNGQDPLPDTYFTIDNAGALNDTWTVDISGTVNDPSTPDRDTVSVSVVTTVTASEDGDELALCSLMANDLNSDANFIAAFLKATCVRDRAIIHVSSTKFSLPGEFYERSNTLDFQVSVTGSAVGIVAFDKIESRAKPTSLGRDPNNPHNLGVQAISGTVSTLPGGIGDQFQEKFKDGGSSDMLVNGSGTPVNFIVLADSSGISAKRRLLNYIRCYGGGNGIKFGQFLSKSGSGLSNGIQINIESQGELFSFFPIKTTEDWKNLFSTSPGSDFRLDIQAGGDEFISDFRPAQPIPLEPNTSDNVTIIVQDNITSGISNLECLTFGFEEET